MKKENYKFNKAVKSLRRSLFLGQELTYTEITLAQILIKDKFGKNAFSEPTKIKIPNTWNIRLHELYEHFKNVTYIPTKLKGYFHILSLEKHEGKYDWIQEEVSEYFKECIISGKSKPKVLFKSKRVKIKASFNERTVTLKNKGVTYSREFTLDELILFDQVKELANKKN